MPPYQGGGEMIRDVTLDDVTYGEPPHRFEAGTPPIVQAIGLGAAIDYMNSIGRDAILAQENALRDYAHGAPGRDELPAHLRTSAREGGHRVIRDEGAHAHDVATVIDRSGVAVRAGTHCAQPLLCTYGVTSTCRASFAFYNTLDEVDRACRGPAKGRSSVRLSV